MNHLDIHFKTGIWRSKTETVWLFVRGLHPAAECYIQMMVIMDFNGDNNDELLYLRHLHPYSQLHFFPKNFLLPSLCDQQTGILISFKYHSDSFWCVIFCHPFVSFSFCSLVPLTTDYTTYSCFPALKVLFPFTPLCLSICASSQDNISEPFVTAVPMQLLCI